MAPFSDASSEADFHLAKRAVALGWLNEKQVEASVLEREKTPTTPLRDLLPLTPEQFRELEKPRTRVAPGDRGFKQTTADNA